MLLALPIIVAAHSLLQVLFLTACSLVCAAKGLLQRWQVFQNGYTRLLFPCGFFCCDEYFHSASFNKAAMVSGDDLHAMISDKAVSGICVVVDVDILNRLVAVFLGLYIVAEYGIAYLGSMVRARAIRRCVLGLIV
jgi:hypothetical protein